MYKNDARILIEIAHMYYGEGRTQDQISKKLNISRSLVSKHLAKAREDGLVEITIHDENIHPNRTYEEKLKKKYDLEDAVCVNASDPNQIKRRIGDAAAKYLSRVIKPDSTIGVSSGTTVHEVASNIHLSINMNNITFVPLVGGLGREHTDIQANVVCDIFARRTGGLTVALHAPVLVDDIYAKEILMKQRFIKDVFDVAKKVDIALVGIGGRPTYHEMTKAYLHKVDPIEESEVEMVTGDVCYNFFDRNGNSVDSDWNKRVMAISLDDLKKIPLVIGVAGGASKIDGIYGALEGKIVNVLITDIYTAKQLLGL